MIIEYKENIDSDFEGTIFDIETIGDFDRFYKCDSRQYKYFIQTILGYLDHKHLHIYCAKNMQGAKELKEVTRSLIESAESPFYAFNCNFESGVWFHSIGLKVQFDGELQQWNYESKREAVKSLGIPNYDDPFFDDGFKCIEAWSGEDYDKAIAHNRACLLKERDILLNRGYREPNISEFVK